jgi:hypothetical protein
VACLVGSVSFSDESRDKRKLEFLSHSMFSNNRHTPQSVAPPTGTAVSKSAAAAPITTTAAHEEECGTSAYLGNYCFKPTPTNEWLLCTDKWGGCITHSAKAK